MTTLDVVSPKRKPEPSAEELAALELVRLAKERGLSLTGPSTWGMRRTVAPRSVTRPMSATGPVPRRC